MTIEEIKNHLKNSKEIAFELPNGKLVPNHFHVTEVGKITKEFIDCGGTLRNELVANFQLWEADDYDHRLHPEKLVDIIELSQKLLNIGDLEIEVEYQSDTIGKYSLDYADGNFKLIAKQTDCLARDKCAVPEPATVFDLSGMTANSCAPGSGCC
jgi:hypothetical protein